MADKVLKPEVCIHRITILAVDIDIGLCGQARIEAVGVVRSIKFKRRAVITPYINVPVVIVGIKVDVIACINVVIGTGSFGVGDPHSDIKRRTIAGMPVTLVAVSGFQGVARLKGDSCSRVFLIG